MSAPARNTYAAQVATGTSPKWHVVEGRGYAAHAACDHRQTSLTPARHRLFAYQVAREYRCQRQGCATLWPEAAP